MLHFGLEIMAHFGLSINYELSLFQAFSLFDFIHCDPYRSFHRLPFPLKKK